MLSVRTLGPLFGVILGTIPAIAQGQPSLHFKRVSSALSSPVFVTHAPGDFDRLFIVQRSGQIRILNLSDDTLNGSDFITIPGILSGGEQGLLGLAFHPDYQNNGYFYVCFTDNSGGDTRIMRFSVTANPNVANPSSGVLLLEIDQPQTNHNGGWIGFGPEGYLYIASGDGGGSNDSGTGHTAGTGNAQDITDNLLGKMLRIDVDGDDFPADPNRNYAIPPENPYVNVVGDDEIFLYGLRNPWRCSFDRETWDLYIGDVGQGNREEINVRLFGSNGPRNYGWRLREGMIATPSGGVGGSPPVDNVNPIYDYGHGAGQFTGPCVTGGYVYRGPVADLQGHYFFADYIADTVWSLKYDRSPEASFNGTNYSALTDWTSILTTDAGTISNHSSFGEDAAGNLYICDLNGELFRLESGSISAPVAVESFEAARGIYLSGGLPELGDSDDAYLVYKAEPVRNQAQPPIWLEFLGRLPSGSCEALYFELEAHTSIPRISETTELFNFVTNQYDLVRTRQVGTVDERVEIELTGSGSEYVAADGAVRARLGWKMPPNRFHFNWQLHVDQVRWRFIE